MEKNTTPPQTPEFAVDFKDLFYRVVGFWPFILVFIFLGTIVAFTINRYSSNIYEIKTVLSVEESDNPLASMKISLAFNWGGMNEVDSKIATAK